MAGGSRACLSARLTWRSCFLLQKSAVLLLGVRLGI